MPGEPLEGRSPEHRTVSRAMGILEAVIANEPRGLRLGDLSERLEAPKSSIHGLAKGLVATGYLREHQGRYFQGQAVALLDPRLIRLPTGSRTVLRKLASEVDETAILAALLGESVINVEIVESTQTIRASPVLNVRRPLWPTSYGKVFLAFMDSKKRESYIRRNFEEGRRDAVESELKEIGAAKIAFNREESIPGLLGLSAPVITGGGEVNFAIGVAGPADRMRKRENDLINAVAKAAEDLSAQATS